MKSDPVQDIRQYTFNDLELPWSKMPWLNVADLDKPFTKNAFVDLDPAGGPVPTVTISLGGLDRTHIVIEDIDVTPLDPFSIQNTEIRLFVDGRTPVNRWLNLDQTVSPNPVNESEIAVDRLLSIPPGSTLDLRFLNLSAFGRCRCDVEIRGFISRIVN